MNSSVVAQKYAVSFFEILKEQNHENVYGDLIQIKNAISSDPQVKKFFYSPLVRPNEKLDLLKKSLENENVSEITKNFVYLLCIKNRISFLEEIVFCFEQEINRHKGMVSGVVVAASEMNEEQQKTIKEKIEKLIDKKVNLKFEYDKSLIGGLKAQVGDFVIDDSLSAHLMRLNEDLNRRMV